MLCFLWGGGGGPSCVSGTYRGFFGASDRSVFGHLPAIFWGLLTNRGFPGALGILQGRPGALGFRVLGFRVLGF